MCCRKENERRCKEEGKQTDLVWVTADPLSRRLWYEDQHQLQEVEGKLHTECGEPKDILNSTLQMPSCRGNPQQ